MAQINLIDGFKFRHRVNYFKYINLQRPKFLEHSFLLQNLSDSSRLQPAAWCKLQLNKYVCI